MHRSDLFALVVGMGMGVGMCGGVLDALLALRARSMELSHVVRQYGGLYWEPASLVTGADSHHEAGDAYTLTVDSGERRKVATISHPFVTPLTPQSQHFTHGLV